MNDSQALATPVAFLIFNRPATTQRVFDAIARARPRKLLVVADGPRAGHASDRANSMAARKIIERVDWPCEVVKNYSETNLGCRERVSSGIDWVFSEVEEAIILEDDCVPNPSFFAYCEAMLAQYRTDTRVMHVSGVNFQQGARRSPYSYYFSRIAHVWGWASWRRAWQNYDVRMTAWPELRFHGLVRQQFPAPNQTAFWEGLIDDVHQGIVGTWDVQWVLACWAHAGLSIIPEVNLISNVGAGEDATHTKLDAWYMDLPTRDIGEISHPPFVFPNGEADEYTMRAHYCCPAASVAAETSAGELGEPEATSPAVPKESKPTSGWRSALKRFRQWTAPLRHPWREIQRSIEVGIRKGLQQRPSTPSEDHDRTALMLDQIARELAQLRIRIEGHQNAAGKPGIAGTVGPVGTQQMALGNLKLRRTM